MLKRIRTACLSPSSPASALPQPRLHSQDSGRGFAGTRVVRGQRRPRQHALHHPDANQQGHAAEAARRMADGAVRRWRRRAGDAGGEGRPAVHDGRLLRVRVRRQDAARPSGSIRRAPRRRAPGSPTSRARSRDCPAREGVAVGDGLVFVGLSNAHVVALREKTGEQVWDVLRRHRSASSGPGCLGRAALRRRPRVRRHVRRSRASAERSSPLTARPAGRPGSGSPSPDPGDPGHETWPTDNDTWKIGGGALWLVGAADPELGLVYFGTGNGVPQYAGDLRAGDNLYLCSLVALDIKTGKLKWYYQTIRHDIWEADIAQSPVVYDAQIGGRDAQARRRDAHRRRRSSSLDRETGKPDSADRGSQGRRRTRRSHTVATQPYPVGADRMLPDCDEWSKKQIPAGFKLGCFFSPGVARRAEPADAGLGHARHADGLQPADRLLLRARQRVAAVVPPRGGSVRLHPRRRPRARACRPATASWPRSTDARERSRGRRISPARVRPARWRRRRGLLFQTMPDGNLIASRREDRRADLAVPERRQRRRRDRL